jgi:predicted permease
VRTVFYLRRARRNFKSLKINLVIFGMELWVIVVKGSSFNILPQIPMMLLNYCTIALRNLWRKKLYSGLNIFGLALGLACSALIALWAFDEISFNRFHENAPRLYRVLENQTPQSGDILTTSSTPEPLAKALKDEIPEIERVAQIEMFLLENTPLSLTETTNKSLKKNGYYVSSDFAAMFSFPALAGNPEATLSRQDGVVLTESLARALFGEGIEPEKMLSKTVRIAAHGDFTVGAIVKDSPKNSSLRFDFLLPFTAFLAEYPHRAGNWGNNSYRLFIQLREGVLQSVVDNKIRDMVKRRNEGSIVTLFTQPISDMHLYGKFERGVQSGGKIEYVRLFLIVAAFILLIACVNFVNLSTAQSLYRAKEVAIRKTVGGASRWSLIQQFFIESLVVSIAAVCLALVFVELALPTFKELTGKEIALRYGHLPTIGSIAAAAALTALLAGSYPAFMLSSFKIVPALKGASVRGKSAQRFREILVVGQFFLAMTLIVGTFVVYRQIEYIKNKNIGVDTSHIISIQNDETFAPNYEQFKRELTAHPAVHAVSLSGQSPVSVGNNTWGLSWAGKAPNENLLITTVWVGMDFLEATGVELKAGRDFSTAYPSDTASILINEEAARQMRLQEPIVGQEIRWGDEATLRIIGVVKDFHTNSLHSEITPSVIVYWPRTQDFKKILIRAKPGAAQEALAATEAAWKKTNSTAAFEYKFVSEEAAEMYKTDILTGKIALIFAILAVAISCLGLFGLAAFAAESRTKEIGIRKVLGASVGSIIGLLSKDFLRLVFLAIALATPAAYFLANKWLQNFAYKIEISWFVFALSGLAAVAIAFLTVAAQAWRAARANPVESLRSE